MKRGDVVVCVISGDYGKPRPAVVLQSDFFNPTHASIVICPITTHLIEAPLFRVSIKAAKLNGLSTDSQIMVDKIIAIKKEKITKKIGNLLEKEQRLIDDALNLWLGL